MFFALKDSSLFLITSGKVYKVIYLTLHKYILQSNSKYKVKIWQSFRLTLN